MMAIFYVEIGTDQYVAKVVSYAGRNEEVSWTEPGDTKIDILKSNCSHFCGQVGLRLARRLDPSKPFGEGNIIELQNLDRFTSLHLEE